MKRKALDYLTDWKDRSDRKPLVVRGARQVGKSYLVRELFGRTHFRNTVEVNLEQSRQLAAAFDSNDPAQIVPTLELSTGQRIVDGETLLFLDEIQTTPNVLQSLRYFKERRPGLHVVAAGSLLEFALTEQPFSMPVGRVEYMFLEPLSFEEFLRALGKDLLADWVSSYAPEPSRADASSPRTLPPVPEAVHGELMRLVATYWLVGGLPEIVQSYAETGSLLSVERLQQNLLSTYVDDFSKYRKRVPLATLEKVFAAIPRQVGEAFSFVQVDRESRSRDLSAGLALLEKAGIAIPARRTSANGLPLAAEENGRRFKAFFVDTGLCCRQLGLAIDCLSPSAADFLCDKGGVCEQFVSQMLRASEAPFNPRSLHYWTREKKGSSAEVDFLIQSRGKVVPLEVKAGATGRMRSLHEFLREKGMDFAVRVNGDLPSYLETTYPGADGRPRPFRLLSLPFYLAEQVRRLADAFS